MADKRPAKGGAKGLRVKRIYEPPAAGDGYRVLVDRLWPRGIAKEKAAIDMWLKDVSPSDALRKRVHGDPDAWDQFVVDYHAELEREPANAAALSLIERMHKGPVTLLYAARNETHNNAIALKLWLDARARRKG
jgi:uncharacterized protein YeaO (DUF488 family)